MEHAPIEMPIRRKVDFAAIALILTLLGTLVQSTWQASRLNSKVEAVEQRQADRDQEQKQVIAGLTQAVESLRVATAQLQTAVAVLQDRSSGASAREGAR